MTYSKAKLKSNGDKASPFFQTIPNKKHVDFHLSVLKIVFSTSRENNIFALQEANDNCCLGK